MAGMPGVGKSTLGLALGRELGWPVLDKDTVKVALLEEEVPESIAGPASYYVPLALCRDLVVQQQLSVIFDSPAAYPNVVEQAQKITDAAGGQLKVILCHADSKVRNQRLSERPRRLSQMQSDPSTDEENLRRFAHLPPTTLRLEMECSLHELVAEALSYISHET
jgi:predicted kinase